MKIKLKHIAEAFSWLLLLAVLAPFLLYAFPQVVGSEDALVVLSGSMEPEIPTGSVIWIQEVNESRLGEGDTITYVSGETSSGDPQFTTHRIINVNGGETLRFRTKGDNNEDPDPGTVLAQNIVGKHQYTVPYMGYMVSWASTPQAFVVLVILPASVLVPNEIKNIGKEMLDIEDLSSEMRAMENALVAVIGVTAVLGVIYLTDLGSRLFESSGGFSLSPFQFGLVLMGVMAVSMAGLMFRDLKTMITARLGM